MKNKVQFYENNFNFYFLPNMKNNVISDTVSRPAEESSEYNIHAGRESLRAAPPDLTTLLAPNCRTNMTSRGRCSSALGTAKQEVERFWHNMCLK